MAISASTHLPASLHKCSRGSIRAPAALKNSTPFRDASVRNQVSSCIQGSGRAGPAAGGTISGGNRLSPAWAGPNPAIVATASDRSRRYGIKASLPLNDVHRARASGRAAERRPATAHTFACSSRVRS
jgi:hypothetical protein